jgi:hypothetical protein
MTISGLKKDVVPYPFVPIDGNLYPNEGFPYTETAPRTSPRSSDLVKSVRVTWFMRRMVARTKGAIWRETSRIGVPEGILVSLDRTTESNTAYTKPASSINRLSA